MNKSFWVPKYIVVLTSRTD